MKIAAVSITMNDSYKLQEWKKWYEEYKDEVFVHIIVDNASDRNYVEQIKINFPDSILIERERNGACTIAYNDGIRKALEIDGIDAIMLIGNDVRVAKGGLTKLYNFLFSDETLGIVSPICLKKDSDIVEDFGSKITKLLTMDPISSGAGKHFFEIREGDHYSETVLGGCCMAKVRFYREVGLQDEKLFMYSDEVDTGIRARKAGFKLGYTKEATAWHQHINIPGHTRRHPFSQYLIARNKVYLANKHFGRFRQIYVFFAIFFKNSLILIKYMLLLKRKQIVYPLWSMIGACYGLVGNMEHNKYTSLQS